MKNIEILNESMINQIAAGEVVERPVSVVKELVENSMDAGATEITIEIKDGGISFIRITDNGKGIPKEQVKTAFLRHATSKIENMNDLLNVMTMGFRGEALSSIASVSQVELITKTEDEDTGTRCEIEGEEVLSIRNVGSPTGTTIIVNNLFFNVPTRRNFLKRPAIEAGYISDVINKFALGHPDISFKYINNGSVSIQTNGDNNLKTSIFKIYGMEVAKKIIPVNYETSGISLDGFIGRPEVSRGNRNYENIYINGRLIRSKLIESAIEDAYKTKLPIGKFPMFVLNLTIKPELIDVNVHPTKLEIRFSNEEEIHQAVYEGTIKALQGENLIPDESWGKKEKFSDVANTEPYLFTKQETINLASELSNNEIKHQNTNNQQLDKLNFETNGLKGELTKNDFADDLVKIEEEKEVYYGMPKEDSNVSVAETRVLDTDSIQRIEEFDFKNSIADNDMIDENSVQSLLDKAKLAKENLTKSTAVNKNRFFKNYTIVGQAFATYWIVEQAGSLYIIDQHAAHERVMYEQITEKLKSGHVDSQQLITPVVVNLSDLEIEILNDNLDLVEKFGFEIEKFGKDTYALRSVPFIFNQPENINFFLEIIDKLGNVSTKITNIYETKIDEIATISCKAAVKGNDRLSYQEAEALIKKMLEIENPFTCPHGRPTIIEMSKYELEKKFKRV